MKSSQSSATNKENLSKRDSDLFLKQFFYSDEPSNLVRPWNSFKLQEKLITIPSPDVTTVFPSVEPIFNMAVDSSQNVGQQAIVNAISDYRISTNKLPLNFGNKSIKHGESIHAQQIVTVPEYMTSICEVDMFDTRVGSCQELPSQLIVPVENSVDSLSFNQVFECCSPVDQCLLTDAFPESSWIEMEASDAGALNMTGCQNVSHQRNYDNKYAESPADKEYQTIHNEVKDNRSGIHVLDAYSALECAQQTSNRLSDLSTSQTPWMLCNLPQKSILSPIGDDLQKILESDCLKSDHQTTATPRNILSSKLASLLQKESAPSQSSVSSLQGAFVRHVSDYSLDEKNALSNEFAHYNFCSTIYQHNNGSSDCFETDFSSDSMWCAQQTSLAGNIPSSDSMWCAQQTSLAGNIPSSDSMWCAQQTSLAGNIPSSDSMWCAQQTSLAENIPSSDSMWCAQQTSLAGNIPSSVSKLPTLNHEFLSSSSCHVSACDTDQGNPDMQYSSHSESDNLPHCAATVTFSEFENTNDLTSFFSTMTSRKNDPFLHQTSFKNSNSLTYTGQTDDLHSSTCSANGHLVMSQRSQIEQGKEPNFEIQEINHGDFCSAPEFVVSESPMSDAQFVSQCFGAASLSSDRVDELDNFLCNISTDTCSATNCNRTANCKTMQSTENVDFDTHLAPDTPLCCGSNDSSDSETLGPTSLLRTLLDKEEKSVQGPLTYAEWIFQQTLKKKCDIKKTKISYLKSEIKHADNKRARNSRNIYRKSVHMPLPMSSRGVKINVSKSKLSHKKPTKELPLPVSTKITTKQPSLPSQENNNTESVPQTNNELNNNITENSDQHSQESSNGFHLPDDLLDMAMEYCASMETDQEDDLITDLSDHFLSEDHLNSLCGSPPQTLKSICSSNTHIKPGSPIHSLPYSVSPSSKENYESSTNEVPIHLLESQSSDTQEHVSNLQSRSSQSIRTTVNNLKRPQNSQTNSASGRPKLSLLRTAVTTPDVDKLIQHIPLGNSYKYSVNNHDVLVPNSAKLQDHALSTSSQASNGNLYKMPPVNTIKSLEPPSLLHPCKDLYKHTIASDNKPPVNYVCKTPLSKDLGTRRQHQSHCHSTTAATDFPKPKSGPSRFVLKISIHQDCSSTATNSNKIYENSVNQNFKHINPHTTSREAGVSVTDSSVTQPVSVIIMRKENNRSRRSKSIAIQTDNDPGEKYPEFEHSPSDTFLYPSVIVCSPSSTTSEECDMSPSASQRSLASSSLSSLSSRSNSSLANMSELEMCLCGHLCDASSSPRQESLQTLPNSSFLQRLLMGQLSKDQYQHLDKQMMEAEKRVMISSAVL